MIARLFFAFVLALSLSLSAGPAFADDNIDPGNGGSSGGGGGGSDDKLAP
jgi:hypothetical protein